jgi:hypothetical protein
MNVTRRRLFQMPAGGLLVALASTVAPAWGQVVAPTAAPAGSTQNASMEEIYVAHSIRISDTFPLTAFCDNAPFKGTRFEAYFTWSSVQTSADGRLSNPAVETIGDIRGCFGLTPDPTFVNASTEGTIAGIPFKGIGSCQAHADFPEKGITEVRCFQALSGLPDNYVGGALLNNAIGSQSPIGSTSSPPGYLQSGLATFRLWKKRTSDQ